MQHGKQTLTGRMTGKQTITGRMQHDMQTNNYWGMQHDIKQASGRMYHDR